MIRVLVLDRPGQPHLRLLEGLGPEVEVEVGDRIDDVAAAAPEADVIVTGFTGRALLEAVFPRASRLRWLHALSAGVDHLLFPALVESPVPLTNSRGVFSRALAEFALAALLFFAKDLRRMLRAQAAGVWDPFDMDEVHGRTLGIVGYGDIGRAVARAACPLGPQILALRRRPERSADDTSVDEVVPFEALADLLARSDDVVLALPLTPETRGLIGARELGGMKPGAVLVNVGRGGVVDEAALVRALEQRRIRGAALDVFEQEPLPAGHPFYRLDNVLLSPHCADQTPGWREAALGVFLDNLERYRRGEALANVVDKARGY